MSHYQTHAPVSNDVCCILMKNFTQFLCSDSLLTATLGMTVSLACVTFTDPVKRDLENYKDSTNDLQKGLAGYLIGVACSPVLIHILPNRTAYAYSSLIFLGLTVWSTRSYYLSNKSNKKPIINE